MKRKLILLACLCITGIASAQKVKGIGIGIPLPDPSAALHVDSDNQGVLIPNVELTDLNLKTPIATEAKESLLVYNKKGGAIPAGYYYWVATNATTGRWVRVLTSEDGSEILAGQIQEYFVEEPKEMEMPKLDPITKQVVLDAKGDIVTEKRTVGGTFVYVADKTKVNDASFTDRLRIDIPTLVKEQETITKFGVSQYKLYHYFDGTKDRDPNKGGDTNPVIKESTEIELVYTDESGRLNKYAVRDLLGSDNMDVPAKTNLEVNAGATALIFTDEKGVTHEVPLDKLVNTLETKTSLLLTANDELVYSNEKGEKELFSLRPVVKEPWYNADTRSEATANNQNVFIEGWVGIGLNAQQAAEARNNIKTNPGKFPDEKLRVNGSIYARNSYYADYVFENYFTKEASALKYDYNFKDLATVESFIKANYHLPGITPVAELEKSKDNGYLINVSELSIQLLEKVEELYLHTIDQQKIIDQQKAELLQQKTENEKQEVRLQQIEAMLNIGK